MVLRLHTPAAAAALVTAANDTPRMASCSWNQALGKVGLVGIVAISITNRSEPHHTRSISRPVFGGKAKVKLKGIPQHITRNRITATAGDFSVEGGLEPWVDSELGPDLWVGVTH